MFDFYIVTTVYNAIETIDRTIWSVISQEGDVHIHYHIQDAGSTDGTWENLKKWQERLNSSQYLPAKVSFSIDSKPDSGMYEGIKRGFEHLDIPEMAFMGYLNGDDLLCPEAVSTLAQVSNDLPEIDWFMGWRAGMDKYGRILCHNINNVDFPQYIIAEGLAEAIHHAYIQQESTVWRKRLYDKAGGLDTSFKLAGDWDLWRRFAQHSEMVQFQKNFGIFCARPGQKSESKEAYFAEINAIIPENIRKEKMKDIINNNRHFLIKQADLDEEGTWKLFPKYAWLRRELDVSTTIKVDSSPQPISEVNATTPLHLEEGYLKLTKFRKFLALMLLNRPLLKEILSNLFTNRFLRKLIKILPD